MGQFLILFYSLHILPHMSQCLVLLWFPNNNLRNFKGLVRLHKHSLFIFLWFGISYLWSLGRSLQFKDIHSSRKSPGCYLRVFNWFDWRIGRISNFLGYASFNVLQWLFSSLQPPRNRFYLRKLVLPQIKGQGIRLLGWLSELW